VCDSFHALPAKLFLLAFVFQAERIFLTKSSCGAEKDHIFDDDVHFTERTLQKSYKYSLSRLNALVKGVCIEKYLCMLLFLILSLFAKALSGYR
jgi:hypothetical protein